MLSIQMTYSVDLMMVALSLSVLVCGIWLSLNGTYILKRARSFAFLYKGIQIIDEEYVKVCHIKRREVKAR